MPSTGSGAYVRHAGWEQQSEIFNVFGSHGAETRHGETGRHRMKLQDALERSIKEFGMSALKEKRLVFLLSDYKAFDDYPAVKPIMKSIVDDGYGKELCRLGMEGSSEECLNYAGGLKKALSADRNFKPDLACYAVDCILSAMGLVSSVKEPSDHGFEPFGNGAGSPGQVNSRTASAGAVAPDDSMEILSDSWTAPVETSVRAQNPLGVEIQKTSKATVTSPFGNMSAGTGTHVADQNQDIAVTHGSQQPSGDSPAKAVNSDRIGRMGFWIKNILYSLLTGGLFYLMALTLESSNIKNDDLLSSVIAILYMLPIMSLIGSITCVWEKRAHDLGEEGKCASAHALWAYFSFLFFYGLFSALFLETTDSVTLMFVFSAPGVYLWIKYGFVKGDSPGNQPSQP